MNRELFIFFYHNCSKIYYNYDKKVLAGLIPKNACVNKTRRNENYGYTSKKIKITTSM